MGIFGKIFSKEKESSVERKTKYERRSKETQINIPLLNVDGKGETDAPADLYILRRSC